MAFIKKSRVRERTTTTGTGVVTLAGAANGYRTFASVMSVNDTCWYCIVHPGTAWEIGVGTYSGTNQLTRSMVRESSNSGLLVNFAAGSKDVFIGLAAPDASFEPGTAVLFQQTTAPIGWTKQTTHNDKALRIVSGTAGSGGSNSFSTVMAQTTVGNTTLDTSQIPAHSHSYSQPSGSFSLQGGGTFPSSAITAAGATSGSSGGGGSHNHTLNMAIQYVDAIICTKD